MARAKWRLAVIILAFGLAGLGVLVGLWLFWLAGSLHLLAASLTTLGSAEWTRRTWEPLKL